MKVKLLEYTNNPEKVISMAAKLCYSPVGIDEIESGLTEDNVDKFLNRLMNLGHESPIEHVCFTFGVEGISRTCSHQLVRHRIASYSQQSQRYVKLDQFEYIIPPYIENNEEAKALFIDAMKQDQKTYDELVEILSKQHLEMFLKEGKEEKEASRLASKKAIEDARFVFPNACETKVVFTMNARTLLHFFRHRCCNRAQWEIRKMSDLMLKELKKVAPILFKNAGPNCLNEACPEGNMTCGKIKEIREKYKNMN
ncbi:MAG: FAD-dependent thymidylate synthase [Peptostreptococcaceae bacterium]|nr:FAD-dependent thymidylate synthase [Peptostreptococcaceae bacterium]